MTRVFTHEEAAKFLFLINYGYDDYLGARTLLNSGVYLPALTLAHTAIEKQIKSILYYFEDTYKYGHKTTEMIDSLKIHDDELLSTSDIESIILLEKCYHFRYIDSKNRTLDKIEFPVAELLFTLDSMTHRFQNKIQFRNSHKTKYQIDVKENRKELYHNNRVVNSKVDIKDVNVMPYIFFCYDADQHAICEISYIPENNPIIG
jgi:HEPN domain-containing protein